MSGMLSFETALGAMQLVKRSDYGSLFQSLGVTGEDYQLTCGTAVWTGMDRARVRQTLDAFSAGTMDLVGVSRFELPAEYLAAVIVMFVHPVNVMIACRWMENMRPAEIIVGASSTPVTVDPAEVFALCCDLMADDRGSAARASFEKQVGIAQARLREREPAGKE